jgi:hypothetical protein
VKRPAVWLALALLLFTGALLTYRIVWLGYPVFPTAPGRTWQLLIDAHIKGGGEESTLALALPTEQVGRMLVEEKVTSGALHFNLLREGPNRVGTWSGPIGPGEEEINYRAIILIRPGRSSIVGPPALENSPPIVAKEEQALAERLARNWRSLSPTGRIKAVAAAAAGEWRELSPDDPDTQAWKIVQGR